MYVTVAQPCKAFTMSKLTNSMQTLHLYLDHDAVLPVFIMDARNMAAFPDQSFDLVIDKGEVILLTVAAKPQPAPLCPAAAAQQNAWRFQIVLPCRFVRYLTCLCPRLNDIHAASALLDAQLCTSSNVTHVASQVQEMYRVLKPGGNYIVISHGGPDTRLGYLTSKRLDWTITDKAIGTEGLRRRSPTYDENLTCLISLSFLN
jgi:SAM-dependent methyltransferase